LLLHVTALFSSFSESPTQIFKAYYNEIDKRSLILYDIILEDNVNPVVSKTKI
jgi:hypothetical protein